ncbi:VWA domain-containing protein, partial [Bifidobacterium bifidum]
PADIVVVFDTSGSMSNPMGDNSRLEVAKTAVNSMAQHLLTSENQGKDSNIRMALVPFSTTAGNVSNFTGNAMDIVSAVNGLGADGGTNWEAALKAANAKLTSGRKGVKKYIVFMSDGDPTFRTSSVRTGTDWWGRPTYDDDDRSGLPAGVHGSGSSDRYGANLSSAVAEANRRGDTTLFSVGVSSDPTKMRGFADQTKGSYYSATSTDELNKAFADIIGQINRKSSYKNVSITDTLSDYAEFVNANFGSNDVTVTASKDGNGVDLNESDYTVTVSGKTVKVTFADGYELQDGVTYTVTFKVKPTQKAYNEYAANKQNDDKTGYKDVLGADNTDADGHHTSSNLPGFHSNADHGAKLGYTVVNTVGDQTTETPGSVEYPHPVLQVKTGKIQVTKNWSDGAEKHGNGSVTVTLKQCNAQGEDCKDINRTVTLNNQGQWAGAFENLAPGTYRVEESSVDGYTASYNPENQLVTVTADDLWAAPDNNNMTTFDNVKTYPVTITNTFVAVSALPMTGGATTRDWLVYGGGFGLLAALVRIGYFIWRKRRLV